MNYSYIREKVNSENSENLELSILLSQDGFSFYVCPKDGLYYPAYFFSKQVEKTGYNDLSVEIKTFNEFDHLVFHRAIAVFHTESFSIIPDEFSSPDHHELFLFLTRNKKEGTVPLISQVSEMDLNILFEMPADLYDSLISRFPGIRFIHSACPSFHFGYRKQGPLCLIYHYGSSISVSIFSDQKLKLFNIFPVQNENDLVYFTRHALRSCNMLSKDIRLFLLGDKEPESADFELIKRYISEPTTYKPDFNEINELSFPGNITFNHLEGLLCGS